MANLSSHDMQGPKITRPVGKLYLPDLMESDDMITPGTRSAFVRSRLMSRRSETWSESPGSSMSMCQMWTAPNPNSAEGHAGR